MLAMTSPNSTATQEVCHSSYFKLFLYYPRTNSRYRMNQVSVQRGNRDRPRPWYRPGCTQVAATGLAGRVTAAATGPVGLPGQCGNCCP